MSETPRVMLMMFPSAGYDRGLLHGIARYSQLHGPWMFCLLGDHPRVSGDRDRARPSWGKKLLVETDLPAEKIANLSGCSSLSYMCRSFAANSIRCRRNIGGNPAFPSSPLKKG